MLSSQLVAAASPEAPPPVSPAVALGGSLAVVVVITWMRLAYGRRTRELRESEERFRGLFEHAIEGVYENEAVGGFRRVNPAMARILGYASPAEVLKLTGEQTAAIYVSPTRREEFFAALNSGDVVANFESEIRRPDGSTAWIKENVWAVRDARRRLVYLQGFVSDITARRAAEAALRASEERYRVLFQHSPVAMVEYDYRPTLAWLEHRRAEGVSDLDTWLDAHPEAWKSTAQLVAIVGANAAALRLFGAKDLAEGVSRLSSLYTSEVFAARRATLLALWHGRTETEGEFTVRTLDGLTLHTHYRWRVPIVDGQPYYERTQLALLDLTQIKAAEIELAEERERLRVTLTAMAEAVVTTDASGAVQFINDAAAKLIGCNATSAVGQSLAKLCRFAAEKTGVPIQTPALAAMKAGHAIDLPANATLMVNHTLPLRVEGCCAPMLDEGGKARGAVLVLRDITERVHLEAELLRASKLESIGVLAGGIAHDFNNLLAVVMGNLTLALLDEKTSTSGGRWLREAERGTVRAKELTQQLLTFAKGGEPLRASVRLADVVREAAEFALHGASVRCEFDLSPDLRPADVDKGQIGQVVQNLVLNAVQAMPDGGVIRVYLRNETLTKGTIPRLPAGHYLRLEIIDNGKGIAPDHLPHVFEPFFTTKESGTGLGLATVYSVVQKHRGHVTVESELGRGTTFRIWLAAAQEEPAVPTNTSSPFTRLSGRVLFMDDEEPIRIMTAELLERLGLEVTLTVDGSEAVKRYALAQMDGRPFQLVIMDLTVPGGMGGAAAMREILKIDPNARGIVSSGYSSDPVMANFRAHGFRAMVPKPYKMTDFARTIREVVSG